MMTEENLKALIAALEEKKRFSESCATMKAMEFVRSADEKDRASSKVYSRDAELWAEARNLVLKHRGD